MAKYLLFSTILLLGITNALAQRSGGGGGRGTSGRGPGTGGGGFYCQTRSINNNHPLLLDIAVFNPNFHDTFPGENIDLGIVILVGLQPSDETILRDSEPMIRALQKVRAWRSVSLELSRFLENSLLTMRWFVTENPLPMESGADIPMNHACRNNTKTLVSYLDGRSVIQRKPWNDSGQFSQMGTLIHETLRKIQKMESLGIHLEDRELQKATTLLLFVEPSEGIQRWRADPKLSEFEAKIRDSFTSAIQTQMHENCMQAAENERLYGVELAQSREVATDPTFMERFIRAGPGCYQAALLAHRVNELRSLPGCQNIPPVQTDLRPPRSCGWRCIPVTCNTEFIRNPHSRWAE